MFVYSMLTLVAFSELRREKAWSRIHLVPLLLAEADRDVYRREKAMVAREKEIMKDVPDWEVSRASVPDVAARTDRVRGASGGQERVQHEALHAELVRRPLSWHADTAVRCSNGRSFRSHGVRVS
jgi:hypothetical protein